MSKPHAGTGASTCGPSASRTISPTAPRSWTSRARATRLRRESIDKKTGAEEAADRVPADRPEGAAGHRPGLIRLTGPTGPPPRTACTACGTAPGRMTLCERTTRTCRECWPRSRTWRFRSCAWWASRTSSKPSKSSATARARRWPSPCPSRATLATTRANTTQRGATTPGHAAWKRMPQDPSGMLRTCQRPSPRLPVRVLALPHASFSRIQSSKTHPSRSRSYFGISLPACVS